MNSEERIFESYMKNAFLFSLDQAYDSAKLAFINENKAIKNKRNKKDIYSNMNFYISKAINWLNEAAFWSKDQQQKDNISQLKNWLPELPDEYVYLMTQSSTASGLNRSTTVM